MANRTPSEQAVIHDLQAVANYPESRGFVETVIRTLPGLQILLDVSFSLRAVCCQGKAQDPVRRPLAFCHLIYLHCRPYLTRRQGVRGPRHMNLLEL